MYIQSINTFFIENPKCGSRTIDYVLRNTFPLSDMSVAGHVPIEDAIRRIPSDAKIIGVIRNPVDRLVSSVRMKCNSVDQADKMLEKAVAGFDKLKERISYRVFAPQSSYVKILPRVKLFAFEMLSDLVRSIGWVKEIPHLNRAHPDLSFNEVKNRPLFNSALNTYKKDFDLYENAMARQGGTDV
jgi:hypothetical protein